MVKESDQLFEVSDVIPMFPTLVWKVQLTRDLHTAIDVKILAAIVGMSREAPVLELTAENTDQVVVSVKNGTLLLFPAYLQHSVDANRGEQERVSISFNLMFSSFTENLSKPLW
jgi:hypothetical protein